MPGGGFSGATLPKDAALLVVEEPELAAAEDTLDLETTFPAVKAPLPVAGETQVAVELALLVPGATARGVEVTVIVTVN